MSFSLEHLSGTDGVADMTVLAESVGFGSVWIPEAWGRDAFTLLAVLATRTRTIELATGIVNVFSRTPAIVAQSVASLDEISGGRALLGLGVSGPRVVEHWHGLTFEKVLQRTREFVEVVRLIISGSRADYEGRIFRLRDFSLAFQPPRNSIPIYLAAIGPANVRLAAEIADGWLPIFVSPRLLEQADRWLSEGAARGTRSRSDLEVASYIPALLGKNGPAALRRQIAFYVGAMGSFYYRMMVRSGWATEASRIRKLWQAGDAAAAASAVDDDLLDALTITGDPVTARRRLANFRSLGVDRPIITIPHGADASDIRATLKALGGG